MLRYIWLCLLPYFAQKNKEAAVANDVEIGQKDDQGLRQRPGKWSKMKKALNISAAGEALIAEGKRLRPGGLSDVERQSALTWLMIVILLGERLPS